MARGVLAKQAEMRRALSAARPRSRRSPGERPTEVAVVVVVDDVP